jgi:hypothetical protein
MNPDMAKHSPELNEIPVAKRIEMRAYELFCERGGKHGHDSEDWIQAEKEIARNNTTSKRKAGIARA